MKPNYNLLSMTNENSFGISMYIYWAYDKLGKKSGAKLKMVVKLKK
ncbi:hypothetical protein [Leptotrichia sp. oral taxon 223]|nr:hypothetical protein [Leptotrichia sp. oral taxon 223]NWO19679.1 hypothetical protein [Leptotrichia sp. oral taxon 223]